MRRPAGDHLSPHHGPGLLAVIYPDRAARQAVLAVALLRVPASAENDRRLIQLLSDCIACVPKPADTAGGTVRQAMSRRRRPARPAAASTSVITASQTSGAALTVPPGSFGTCVNGEMSSTH